MAKKVKNFIEMQSLTKYCKANKVSFYDIWKLTDIPETTLYAYRKGRLSIPEMRCRIIADALKADIFVLFPDLKKKDQKFEGVDFSVKKNSGKPSPTLNGTEQQKKNGNQNVDKKGNVKMKIEMEDMIIGSQNLLPEDGKTIKARVIRNHEHVRMLFRLDKMFIERHSACSPGICYDYNGELSVVIQATGTPFLVGNGKEIGELVFL